MQEYAGILRYKILIYKKIQYSLQINKIGLKLSLERICGNSSFKFHGKFIEKFCYSYLEGPVTVTIKLLSENAGT